MMNMNMHGMNQQGVGVPVNQMVMSGVPGGVPPGIMQQPSPQQMQQVMQQQQQQQQQNPQQPSEKLDNISKVKSLLGPLRESLSATLKTAAQVLHQNNQIDTGLVKSTDTQLPRFDKTLEDFYSTCDQIELHLKTSLQCLSQSGSAHHYLPLGVAATRVEPLPPPSAAAITAVSQLQQQSEQQQLAAAAAASISYPQYLSTVRSQISYAKEIHDTLIAAAQNISE